MEFQRIEILFSLLSNTQENNQWIEMKEYISDGIKFKNISNQRYVKKNPKIDSPFDRPPKF